MEKSDLLMKSFDGTIEEHIDLKNYSFMHTGGYAELLFQPSTIDDLKLLHKEFGIINVIGNGSNVLFKGNIDRIVVINEIGGNRIRIDGERIIASAGVSLPFVARKAYENALSGLEELVGIPGTLGGAIKMNAGAYGRTIFDMVKRITVFDMKMGEIKEIESSNLKTKYRDGGLKTGDIVVEAELKLSRGEKSEILDRMANFSMNRRMKQPTEGYSLGSIFKNPKKYPAGWLIEACGLKGKRIGGAFVSDKHANFIINNGTATSKDILDLIDLIRKTVDERFKIKLDLEIVIL